MAHIYYASVKFVPVKKMVMVASQTATSWTLSEAIDILGLGDTALVRSHQSNIVRLDESFI